MLRVAIFSSALLIASCSPKNQLHSILKSYLPDRVTPTLVETCTQFLGPAVGTFSVPSGSEKIMKQELAKRTVSGSWSRAPSLTEFTRRDVGYPGPGISATILDGKTCLRKIESRTDEILFGERDGYYFHSDNREVVIVIFDHPSDRGIIFVQAP